MAIIKGFIANIREKEEYASVNFTRIQNMNMNELMDEQKNIVQKMNHEQDENEMLLYSKVGS